MAAVFYMPHVPDEAESPHREPFVGLLCLLRGCVMLEYGLDS